MITADMRKASEEHVDARCKYAEQQERADAYLFMALSSPVRLRILRLLAASDVPIAAIELIAHFQVAQPTMSHHLRMLRAAGLVVRERDGWSRPYTIVAERMRYACALLSALIPQ